MKSLTELLYEKIVVLDGAMGTQILAHNPAPEDFLQPAHEGCLEILNLTKPKWIQDIHAAYFTAGADAVETNTFGANILNLQEYALGEKTFDLNKQAALLAREVAQSFNSQKYVVGSVGPGSKILTFNQVTYEEMFASYLEQFKGLLAGGVDAILIETGQDIAQIKNAIRACKKAFKEIGKSCPIWTQVTIEQNGATLVGNDISSVLTSIEALSPQVIGINCSVGPDDMFNHLAHLSANAGTFISAQPNAGLPVKVQGKLTYNMSPIEFANKIQNLVQKLHLNIVGGCCGTSPEYIKEIAAKVTNVSPVIRQTKNSRNASSLYTSVAFDTEIKPLFIGERTNVNGSAKFREYLLANNFNAMLNIAKQQAEEGASILDVSLASTGRNEINDYALFLPMLQKQVNIPLMIDSTSPQTIEKSLQVVAGKCVVNSINLEEGEAGAEKVLQLCQEYGAAVVALTIDEQGMAKTTAQKIAIAERIYTLVVAKFGMHPGDLIFDPLTFTIGSGDIESRTMGMETLNAIAALRDKFPMSHIILGLSNISYGLPSSARPLLNSLFLYHAVKNGLDMAILNSSKIIPIHSISESEKKLFNDLIFNNRTNVYDPLKEIVTLYSNIKSNKKEENTSKYSPAELIEYCIINGDKEKITPAINQALTTYSPLEIINKLLLSAMKQVSDKFGAGEMQLPFVLESAETMKQAVKSLEPFLEKNSTYKKGKIILATVKGDVHDIGKNLVEIILSNNGYLVIDIGIKQSIESIISACEVHKPDILGLSGLLVKSTEIMQDNLQYLSTRGISIPVILGGAALKQNFVEEECQKAYTTGKVYYAKDAFAGLQICEEVMAKKKKLIESIHPPFWGKKIITPTLDELFSTLNTTNLIKHRWGFAKGISSELELKKLIVDKGQPIYQKLKNEIFSNNSFTPKCIYGYFPVKAIHDELLFLSLQDFKTPLQSIIFPRQTKGEKICLTNYIINLPNCDFGFIALQVVTIGEQASSEAQKLYSEDKFSEYYYYHMLAIELTECLAKYTNNLIKEELAINNKIAIDNNYLQNCRFSFGYPACPKIENNALILKLLKSSDIGVDLTESWQMTPEQSTCAMVLFAKNIHYFNID